MSAAAREAFVRALTVTASVSAATLLVTAALIDFLRGTKRHTTAAGYGRPPGCPSRATPPRTGWLRGWARGGKGWLSPTSPSLCRRSRPERAIITAQGW